MNSSRTVTDPELALVVGAARSGTTLLRLLLDAHPEVGCPAEAGLPSLMNHMLGVWHTIDADLADSQDTPRAALIADRAGNGLPESVRAAHQAEVERSPGEVQIPEEAKVWIQQAALVAERRYCHRHQKRVYVDKSLDSVNHLPMVQQLFPGTHSVLIFRHVMDTIASGHDASPWGFNAYGYTPYVHSTPWNTVAALGTYWLNHVKKALDWQDANPDVSIRVRYEDLVTDPQHQMTRVFDFLRVKRDLSVLSQAFEREPPRGPGDHKVEHTVGVHARSIGRGKRVPVTLLPVPLRAALNHELQRLGYPAISDSWNTEEREINAARGTAWADRLIGLMASVKPILPPGMMSVAVLAEDDRDLRWIIDAEGACVHRGDGDVESVITGTAEDLVILINDEENLGHLVRAGRIRYGTADDPSAVNRDALTELAAIVGCVRTAFTT